MRDSDAGSGDDPSAEDRERARAVRDTLASRRRQIALAHLLRGDRPQTVTALARRVAVSETELDPADVPVSLLQQTYLELTRVHIPALESVDLLEYDPERGAVRLAAQPRTVRAHLDAVEDQPTTPTQ